MDTIIKNSQLAAPFELMAQVIDEVMWITDIDKKTIIYISPAFERIWGLSCEEQYKNPLTFVSAIHPSDRERVLAAFAKQLDGSYNETYKITRPDGSIRWIHDRSYPPSKMENGKLCVMGLARDVTAQKVSEEALKKSEARFRSIIEGAPIPMAINNDDLQITFLNKSFVSTFGYTTAEIPTLNEWWPKAYPDPKYKKWISEVWQIELQNAKVTGQNFRPIEVNIQCKDGSFRTVLVSAAPLSTGFASDHLVVLYDITNLKKAENEKEEMRLQLMQSSKMASLGELAAGVAHEINNPLGIVEGAASQLTRYKDNSEKFSSKVQSIQKACARMSTIVGGLKKFSRSSDGFNFKKHLLAKITDEAILLMSIKAKRNEVQILSEFESEAQILADEVSIEQVIVNLISNGIDAAKNQQEKWVRLKITEDLTSVILQVIDSGPGVPLEVQKKIFDPFFTTKAIGEGTGLGLSISKGIIADHKASMDLRTDLLHTCFEVKFLKES